MVKVNRPRFGKQPPRYGFAMNPYPDMRISRCPICEQKTGQRKLPLFILVKPANLIALNFTCRYCKTCDLLIAHKHELEHLLTNLFRPSEPETIGNNYIIVGTVEKNAWRRGLQHPVDVTDILPFASDFAEYYEELRVTQPGWYPIEQEPPEMEPPPSTEWRKL